MLDKCNECAKTQEKLAEWYRYIGTTPELTWWRAALYQFGKKFAEWAPAAAIIVLICVATGAVLFGVAWLFNYPVAFAYLAGVASVAVLFQVSSYLGRRY